jgi:hypothetical protein
VIRQRSSVKKCGQCIRHARFWTCPYRNIEYPEDPEAFKLLGYWYGHDACEIDTCDLIFRHCVTPFNKPETLRSSSLLATFPHYGGVEFFHQHVSRELSRETVKDLLEEGLGLVCDHYALSHPTILDSFDTDNIDIEDRMWGDHPSQLQQYRKPKPNGGVWESCDMLDVHTSRRFRLRIGEHSSTWQDAEDKNYAKVELHIVLFRSIPSYDATAIRKESHLRCHGMVPMQFEELQQQWKAGRDMTNAGACISHGHLARGLFRIIGLRVGSRTHENLPTKLIGGTPNNNGIKKRAARYSTELPKRDQDLSQSSQGILQSLAGLVKKRLPLE